MKRIIFAVLFMLSGLSFAQEIAGLIRCPIQEGLPALCGSDLASCVSAKPVACTKLVYTPSCSKQSCLVDGFCYPTLPKLASAVSGHFAANTCYPVTLAARSDANPKQLRTQLSCTAAGSKFSSSTCAKTTIQALCINGAQWQVGNICPSN